MAVAQVYLVQFMIGGSSDDTVASDEIIFASYGRASLRCIQSLYAKPRRLSISL